jgi:hypothetical protein
MRVYFNHTEKKDRDAESSAGGQTLDPNATVLYPQARRTD